jgi:uroporphyrinogen-III synthase
MKVLVTRPAAQAAEWVARLGERGIAAVALPLIEIAAPADPAAAARAWTDLPRQRLVVFVSPNAAEQFFAVRPAGLRWPAGVTAATPGPGTTRALEALGVPPDHIVAPADDAPQFDSEALWQRLAGRDWRGAPVTIVRGEGGGRNWLAETLEAHGAQVAFVAAYRRVAPTLDEGARAALRAAAAAPARHLWFFSSSEAIDHLAALDPTTDRTAAQALTTHPRIAERARRAGFGQVHDCRPTPDAVIACIQSIAT